ncbi:MAG: hypothetical protein NZ990_17840 [Myxococcota bacterium]|nr:hypothetical protein [Myxococcota bacterium]
MTNLRRASLVLALVTTIPLFLAGSAGADKVTSRISGQPDKPASADDAHQADEAGPTCQSCAEQHDKIFDLAVLRPLDAAAVFCGAALMIPASALGLVGGMEPVQDAWDLLVLTSWESLVDRPLGHWGS